MCAMKPSMMAWIIQRVVNAVVMCPDQFGFTGLNFWSAAALKQEKQ
jgi:hypothetical protein